jgi:hypothetical protein
MSACLVIIMNACKQLGLAEKGHYAWPHAQYILRLRCGEKPLHDKKR